MLVKFKTSVAVQFDGARHAEAFSFGQIADLPEKDARGLIEAGHCEELKDIPTEEATAELAEQAVSRRKKK